MAPGGGDGAGGAGGSVPRDHLQSQPCRELGGSVASGSAASAVGHRLPRAARAGIRLLPLETLRLVSLVVPALLVVVMVVVVPVPGAWAS